MLERTIIWQVLEEPEKPQGVVQHAYPIGPNPSHPRKLKRDGYHLHLFAAEQDSPEIKQEKEMLHDIFFGAYANAKDTTEESFMLHAFLWVSAKYPHDEEIKRKVEEIFPLFFE